jgi:hypothetical protein
MSEFKDTEPKPIFAEEVAAPTGASSAQAGAEAAKK